MFEEAALHAMWGKIKQDPASALEALAQLLETHAEDPRLWELYAQALWKLARKEEAKAAYEKSLALDANSLSAHFGLAQILLEQQKYIDALSHLKTCALEKQVPPILYFQIGFCYFQMKQIPEAKLAFEVSLKHQPENIDAWINLGACFMQEEDFIQAIHHFATACRLNEKSAGARFNLACALMKARRYLQARDQFMLYLEKNAQDLEAQYHLGYVYLMLEALVESEACFQKIIDHDPTHVLALHNMANIALKRNEPSVALGYYQRVLSAAPKDDIAKYMVAALAQGGAPPRAPNAYVESLFDAYAERFDQHLTEDLRYQTPQALYDLWKKYAHKKEGLKILDMGCGTGLMGVLLKSHAAELVGVDLSSEMLKIAKEKNCYDALHHKEMTLFFSSCNFFFDLVALADVLVYVGELEAIFSSLSSITSSVLLSIEVSENEDFILSRHGRYQHGLNYVLACAKKAGFKNHHEKKVILRYQNGQPVSGWVVCLNRFFCHRKTMI